MGRAERACERERETERERERNKTKNGINGKKEMKSDVNERTRTFNRTLFKLVDLQICEMENINSNAYTLYIDFHSIFPNECYIVLYL